MTQQNCNPLHSVYFFVQIICACFILLSQCVFLKTLDKRIAISKLYGKRNYQCEIIYLFNICEDIVFRAIRRKSMNGMKTHCEHMQGMQDYQKEN